jgi:hypothetical protein
VIGFCKHHLSRPVIDLEYHLLSNEDLIWVKQKRSNPFTGNGTASLAIYLRLFVNRRTNETCGTHDVAWGKPCSFQKKIDQSFAVHVLRTLPDTA